jgi:hypothetical protein
MQVGDLLQVLPGSIEMVCAAPKGRVQAHNPYGTAPIFQFSEFSVVQILRVLCGSIEKGCATPKGRVQAHNPYRGEEVGLRFANPTYKNQFTFLVNIAILELVNTFTWRGYSR